METLSSEQKMGKTPSLLTLHILENYEQAAVPGIIFQVRSGTLRASVGILPR